MSVVILGMELPKKCEDCEIETCDENYYGDESNHRCSLLYKGYTHRCRKEGRLDDCPLRPLPEKHGALIDRTALEESVLKWLPPDPCGREECEFPFETDICVSMMMEIGEQETIVEAEG